MAKSRPFIINERFRLKELYMVEYPRNSRGSQFEADKVMGVYALKVFISVKVSVYQFILFDTVFIFLLKK